MKVLGIITEDTVNYKKISCTIMMPYCDFKCNNECGDAICQNSFLKLRRGYHLVELSPQKFMDWYYKDNDMTQAIVFQGLEPFYHPDVLLEFIDEIRKETDDDIVIYTGYTEDECQTAGYIDYLKKHKNIIIKFGRMVPNSVQLYDEILGVKLASENQYAKQIS